MKKFSTLFTAAILFATGMWAQQQSRLVGVHLSMVNIVVLEPLDSVKLQYNTNARGMDGTDWDYRYFGEPSIKADTMQNYGYLNGQPLRAGIDAMKYDGQNMLTEWLRMVVAAATPNAPLINSTDRKYEYDANGNMVKLTDRKWDNTAQAWVNDRQRLYVYTAGNLEKETWQQWVNGAWTNQQEYAYTYNANNDVLTYLFKSWDTQNGTLYSQNLTTYGYDANGYFISYITQTYDLVNMVYKDSYRELHANDANGNIIETVTAQWNSATSTWDTQSRLIYAYNSAGLNANDTFELWDAANSVWKPTLTYEYLYDANGNDTSFTLKLWNVDSAKYINSQQLLHSYNSFDQMTEYKSLVWDLANNQWQPGSNDYENHYYYELYNVGVKNTQAEKASVKLYPVPATNTLTIDITGMAKEDFYVTITDMQGRPVKRWKESSADTYHKQISLSAMAAGTYILRVENGTQQYAQVFNIVK